jgi:hypothetical protein
MPNTLKHWVMHYKGRSTARREVYCRAAVWQWIHEHLVRDGYKRALNVRSTRVTEGLFFSINYKYDGVYREYTARWDDNMSAKDFENVLKTSHMLVTGT